MNAADQAPRVGIVMGSRSDWETMQHAAQKLEALGVPHEVRVVSAHRTPDVLFEYAETAASRGLRAIIAGAGGAAHLPGMLAAKTAVPVLGVPVQSKALNGMDSLLSIVQMPAGIPVATFAIGNAGAANAALFAAAMLAADDAAIAAALDEAVMKVLIIHARPLAARAVALAEHLRSLGYEVATADHPDAEAGKAIEVVAGLWDTCGHLQLGRKDVIIAMGGGATTDMAGFVAATWLRGVTLINVPTTLLGMVDAAVGGKTGINTSVGKNLVGSFYPADAVIADMSLLATLPRQDLAAGAAEVIKCGFIADPKILRIVGETSPEFLLDPSSEQLAEITTRAITVKARVVSADLTEGGLREILNYGHTLAHAIERANDYTWRHGDAVAVGCCFAARLSAQRGLLGAEEVALHDELFARGGLPTRYEDSSLEELTHIMASDKKVRRGILRFVLLDGIANPSTFTVEPNELVAPARAIGIGA